MFLRPTESLTVYTQQLGWGLRLSEGKEAMMVLDFVGHPLFELSGNYGQLLVSISIVRE